MKGDPVKEIVKAAFDHGINFIDTAEGVSEVSRFAGGFSRTVRTVYAAGQSEVEMSAGTHQNCYCVTDMHPSVVECSRNSRSAGVIWSFRPKFSSGFGENNPILFDSARNEHCTQGRSKCKGSIPKTVRLSPREPEIIY